MSKKSGYTVVEIPKISVQKLAEYMASSQTRQRSILRDCKFQRKEQIFQHSAAKRYISKYFDEAKSIEWLSSQAEKLNSLEPNTEYKRRKNRNDCNFLFSYVKNFPSYKLPPADVIVEKKNKTIKLNGVIITFNPDLLLKRDAKNKNYQEIGAVMIHHTKGLRNSDEIYRYQTALMFNILNLLNNDSGYVANKKLCIVIDALRGNIICAPSASVRIFKEIQSACESIVGIWDTLKPPKDY
jgi:hypothetical protein